MLKKELQQLLIQMQDQIKEIEEHIDAILLRLEKLDKKVESSRAIERIEKLTTRVREVESQSRRVSDNDVFSLKHQIELLKADVIPIGKAIVGMKKEKIETVKKCIVSIFMDELSNPDSKIGALFLTAVADVMALKSADAQ